MAGGVRPTTRATGAAGRRRHALAFALLLLGTAAAAAACARPSPGPEPAAFSGCDVCGVAIGPGLPAYGFAFETRPAGAAAGDGTIVERVVVMARADRGGGGGGRVVQRLDVSEGMTPVAAGEEVPLQAVDINFDGYRDLALITARGAANAYADYWLFDPAAGAFTALGTYPVFRVDPARRRLATYERGGHGGLIYEATEYAFDDDTLTVVRSETQDWVDDAGHYLRVVRERRGDGGELRVTEREVVAPP